MGGWNSKQDTEKRKPEPKTTKAANAQAKRTVPKNTTSDEHRVEPSGRTTIYRREKEDKLMVMAIDFGTTYSGYAYSFKSSKEEIFTNYWEGVEIKTPTVVLMNKDKALHSFGEKAKEHYRGLIKKTEHKEWYYFENFKMKLFVLEQPLQRSMKLADMSGKEIQAIDVFAAAIKYMKDHFLDKVHNGNDKEKLITVRDVHFIITVPAIWSDLSKQFMRQAAVQAGITDDALTLALEPEAASLYCKETLKDVNVSPGTRYIVADLGGGTADFTCHEVNKDNTLKELQKPCGGDFGGTTVDNAFYQLLVKVFGADTLQRFKKTHIEVYYDLLGRFEVKKKNFQGDQHMILQFPMSLLTFYEDEVGESVKETLNSSAYKDRIDFRQDKIILSLSLANELFDTAVHKIVDRITDILKSVNNVNALVLVGGFSESPYLQRRMKKEFGDRVTILSPKEPASAVIKGAVMYGHNPQVIDSRVCKYTYGIARMMRFKDYHSRRKRIVVSGVSWCDDLFNKHIEVGQTVHVNEDFEAHEYFPVTQDMRHGCLEVYASTEKNPTYVDEEGCQHVGIIRIDLTGGDVKAKVLVKLIFGGTELRVEAVEEKTGKQTIGSVDFLG